MDVVYNASHILVSADDWPPGASDQGVHRRWAVIYYRRGGCTVGRDAAEQFNTRTGDLVFMRPSVLHAWTTRGHAQGRLRGCASLYCLFVPPPDCKSLLDLPEVIPHYSHVRFRRHERRQQIHRCLRTMLTLSTEDHPHGERLLFNLLEQVLLWSRLELRDHAAARDPRIEAAHQFMAEHLHERVTIADVARAAHLSRAQFALLFHQQVGEPPMTCLQRMRIERAKTLLAYTGLKVAAIARMTGFCDANYFAHRFRHATGRTPGAWRSDTGIVGCHN